MSTNTPRNKHAATIKRAVAQLAKVQAHSKVRLLDESDIARAIEQAKNFCTHHGLAKCDRVGMLLIYDPWPVPPAAYRAKGAYIATTLVLTATKSGWKIEASRDPAGANQQTLQCLRCPAEAVIKAARRIFGVELVAKPTVMHLPPAVPGMGKGNVETLTQSAA